jgi:hypothetical protein
MDDFSTWLTQAVYLHARPHDPKLDAVIAERMDELRGESGTRKRAEG